MRKHLIATILATAFCAMPSAQAHSLWVNMTHWKTPVMAEKPSTRMYVGWGHTFPVNDVTDASQFESCTLLLPNGTKEALSFDYTGISTAPIRTKAAGEYVISLVRKPSIYSFYRDGGVEKKSYEPREKIANRTRTVRSQQCATAHFFAGTANQEAPMRVGNALELVPLENPYQAGKNYIGVELPVQLLLDGKPVPYQEVTATYAGFSSGDSMAQRLLTDKNGIAHLRVTHWGQWLLKAKAERPAVGENAKLVDTEVYYTTVTFAI